VQGMQDNALSAQAWQAARICCPLVQDALQIHTGESPVDSIRGKPLCMAANRSLFGTCRMPTQQRDVVYAAYTAIGGMAGDVSATSASGQPLLAAKGAAGQPLWLDDVTQWSAEAHQQEIVEGFPVKDSSSGAKLGSRSLCPWVLVLRHGRTFQVPAATILPGGALKAKSAEEFAAAFVHVMQLCANTQPSGFSPSALTAGDRDTWTAQWEALKPQGGNAGNMNTVIGALLVVCLDDVPVRSAAELSAAGLHGTSSQHVSAPWRHNRWWDKTCQVVVAPPNTVSHAEQVHAGVHTKQGGLHCPTLLILEHSMSDGHVSYCMLSRLISAKALPAAISATAKSTAAGDGVEELLWTCAGALGNRLKASAALHFKSLLATQDIQTSVFNSYGANTIKKFGCSPDAWAQIAFQIAAMRTDAVLDAIPDWTKAAAVEAAYTFWDAPGADVMKCSLQISSDELKPVPQYEPVQMRGFRRGRTECARGASMESLRAGKLMHAICDLSAAVSPGSDVQSVWSALRAAIHGHSVVCRAAASGKAFDRHLFGLKKIAAGDNPDGAVMPDTLQVLSSPALAAASDWRVSTSNLSGGWLKAWGWGQVTESGVGVAYSTLSAFGKDALMLHMAAKNVEMVSGAQRFRPRARVYLTETVRALQQMRLVAELATAGSGGAKL